MLTENAFAALLARLDADSARAAERYEDLRRILVRFFEWRGAPFPEDHADDTFDRVARRLDEGVDVRNIGGYCYSVARLVLLETRKAPDVRRGPLEMSTSLAAPDLEHEQADREARLNCLQACLATLSVEGRELIVTYYRDEKRARIDARKALAARLGLRAEALANRAQRLRDKLERCVRTCLAGRPAT